jgi:hypothetical protein
MIVEGKEDLFAVQGIMRAHIAWSSVPDQYPVFITDGGGAEEILSAELIPLKLRGRLTKTLGVMLDADDSPSGRYRHIRSQCIGDFTNMPEALPPEGLVVENSSGKRLGVWIMPDNVSEGALEIFLRYMVPQNSKSVWDHAVDSTSAARTIGAPYRDCHCDKANLYTWLSWQDEPSQRPGEALTKKILDPHAPSAAPFVKWFRELYQL